MTIPGFIFRNALRNKRRLILTVLSVSVSLFLFTTLQAALELFENPPTTDQAALRLVTRHKVSLANVLPAKYQHRIERVPGVEYYSKFSFFGGIYRDKSQSNFAQFAVDADKIFKIFPEAVVEPLQEAQFIKEKNACVVGIKLAERFKWKLGDKITFQGTIWPCNPELVIRGFYEGRGIDETIVFFHHDYFDDLMKNRGLVGTFWIKAKNAEAIDGVIETIDAAFRNTDAETKTETERNFQLGFISMIGNVKFFIGSICTVIVFTMLLVTASTMSMAIRERSREIAILKTIGFSGSQIFGLILAESFALAMMGGLMGAITPKILSVTLDFYKMTNGNLPFFPVSFIVVMFGIGVAAILGFASSLIPAYNSVKMTVVEGLKTLD